MFNVDDKYDLPRDVVHKDSLIEIIGRNEFVVENYRCLKEKLWPQARWSKR